MFYKKQQFYPNISTLYLFTDSKSANDIIKINTFPKTMEEFGIPAKLIRLTKATLKHVKCKAKVQNDL
jgi:hypothetical protein